MHAAQALHGDHLTIVQHTAGNANDVQHHGDNGGHEVHVGFENRNGIEHWVALAAIMVTGATSTRKR